MLCSKQNHQSHTKRAYRAILRPSFLIPITSEYFYCADSSGVFSIVDDEDIENKVSNGISCK